MYAGKNKKGSTNNRNYCQLPTSKCIIKIAASRHCTRPNHAIKSTSHLAENGVPLNEQHPISRWPCLKVGSLRNQHVSAVSSGCGPRFLPLHHREYTASLVMQFLGGWHSYFAVSAPSRCLCIPLASRGRIHRALRDYVAHIIDHGP